MVSIADIRRWDPAGLEDAFTQLGRAQDELLWLQDDVDGARSPQGWTGPAAQAAAAEHDRLAERLRRTLAGSAAVRSAVGDAVDTVEAVLRALGEAEYLATAHGFRVGEDGGVDDVHPPVVPEDQVETVSRERSAIRDEVADRLEQVVRTATDVDADLASIMERVERGEIDDGTGAFLQGAVSMGDAAGALSVPGPPPGGTPGDNAGYWDTLSEADRAQVLEQHPEWVGNLDGIPAEARDAANRTILPREIARVQGEIDAVQTQLASIEGPGERIQTTQAQARLDLLNEKMGALRATEGAIGPAGSGRQLLLLDVKPDRPKAAIATGNVDTADHVAVFTPGMNTTVAGDLQRYIGDMEAQQLAADREARRLGNNDLSIATVTWIGYEPPSTDDFGSVSHFPGRSEQAQRGGRDLAGFLDGINTSRDTDPHLSAIGHSYGSTTTGYAMQEAGGDEAVFFGSPGLSVNDSADLNVPAGHATVIEARNDPIADLAAFGADPNHVDGVTNLSAKQERLPDGRVLDESIGHSAYLTRGTTSQHNIAVTIGGMPEQRVEGRPTGIGDALNGLVPN